ncbi:MAG TPA: type II toxin-antitoxin system HicA family toxin [Phycisphaerales bacterium]|nr:type II toxin-antitoxin system HicA family toxin [Phycisphaerales bacterium]
MPSEVRFAEVRRKLESHGWTLQRISGSHHVFIKKSEPRLITLPVHAGKVKPGYISRIKRDFGIDLRAFKLE